MRVCYIEDENLYQELFKRECRKLGFILTVFLHPEIFYQYLYKNSLLNESKNFNIVVTDRFMSGFDAVSDSFSTILKHEFQFSGYTALYSHLIDGAEENFDFYSCKKGDFFTQPILRQLIR